MTASLPTFTLGTTSYIYPGDLVHNAERLAGQVGDMELVLFSTDDGQTNYPDAETIRRLAEVSAQHGLTYTVHLPFDLQHDPTREHPSITHAKRVMDSTHPLNPYAYVFHLEGTGAGGGRWADDGIRAIEAVLPLATTPRQLTLENLENYPPDPLEPVFSALPIARALDIGHLWKAGLAPETYYDRWLPNSRVIHLHGCRPDPVTGRNTDHLSLDALAPDRLDSVVRRVWGWSGVLTLEVFEADYFTSRAALDRTIAAHR
ncbi:MAG: hypothetical protein MUC99_12250 [Anaerolineae bacterium]|nr:hypothetical protein [Anaerolineae bacterium]